VDCFIFKLHPRGAEFNELAKEAFPDGVGIPG
jgi:hypothetical protein